LARRARPQRDTLRLQVGTQTQAQAQAHKIRIHSAASARLSNYT
jgi:hypothetical protein